MFWTLERILISLSIIVAFGLMVLFMVIYGHIIRVRKKRRAKQRRLKRQSLALTSSLKHLRMQHGYSLRQVASALNVSLAALSRWENKQAHPREDNMLRIASFYQITLKDVQKLVKP